MGYDLMSEDLDDYDENEIKSFAKKYLKNKNTQIQYYHSEKGKEMYRKASKKFYYRNIKKCREASRECYKKKLEKMGKKVRPTRGRPRKVIKKLNEPENVIVEFN